MKKCIITNFSIKSEKTEKYDDEFCNIAGRNSSISFDFKQIKKYLGSNPLAKIKLEIVCFGRGSDCITELNVNG